MWLHRNYISVGVASLFAVFVQEDCFASEKKERCIDLMADVAIAAKGNKAWSGTYGNIPEFKIWYAECWRMDNITKDGYTCMDTVRGWIGSAAFYQDTSKWESEYAIKCGRLLD
jgi:hypothetical protein